MAVLLAIQLIVRLVVRLVVRISIRLSVLVVRLAMVWAICPQRVRDRKPGETQRRSNENRTKFEWEPDEKSNRNRDCPADWWMPKWTIRTKKLLNCSRRTELLNVAMCSNSLSFETFVGDSNLDLMLDLPTASDASPASLCSLATLMPLLAFRFFCLSLSLSLSLSLGSPFYSPFCSPLSSAPCSALLRHFVVRKWKIHWTIKLWRRRFVMSKGIRR